MLFWQIHFADNSKTHVGLYVKCHDVALKQKNARLHMTFLRRTIFTKIVMTVKSLASASIFVSVAVKHFTRSDKIN
jgi:hypothetical protein